MKLFCLFVLAFAGNALAAPQVGGSILQNFLPAGSLLDDLRGVGLPLGGVAGRGLPGDFGDLNGLNVDATAKGRLALTIEKLFITINNLFDGTINKVSSGIDNIQTIIDSTVGSSLSKTQLIKIKDRLNTILANITETKTEFAAIKALAQIIQDAKLLAQLQQILTDKEKLLDAIEAPVKVVLSFLEPAIGNEGDSIPPTTVSPTTVSPTTSTTTTATATTKAVPNPAETDPKLKPFIQKVIQQLVKAILDLIATLIKLLTALQSLISGLDLSEIISKLKPTYGILNDLAKSLGDLPANVNAGVSTGVAANVGGSKPGVPSGINPGTAVNTGSLTDLLDGGAFPMLR